MIKPLNFLFTTWEGGGNVTPALEVVRKLGARGHRVRFMSDECNRPEAEANGASFVHWTRAPNRQTRDAATEVIRDWAAATPEEAMGGIMRDLVGGKALDYAQDTIDELRREAADLVVTCELTIGVFAACESVGQRFAVLAPNISLFPMQGMPPMGPGLKPAQTDEERAMHAEIAKGVESVFDAGLPGLNAARAALGLRPLRHLFDQRNAAQIELLATARAFDYRIEDLPPRVRYVGPQIADPAWAKPWKSPWPASDKRPLVTVGFSTTFQNHAGVLQNVIDALAPLEARVLVTLGGSIEREALKPAQNTAILESAPHTIVMRDSSLVITHGGHGTVMRALVNRVPMLIMPHGRDQNDNAARIAYRAAGVALMPNASAQEIRNACTRILNEPAFRTAAKELGDAVAREAESSPVVEELEAAATDSLPSSAAA